MSKRHIDYLAVHTTHRPYDQPQPPAQSVRDLTPLDYLILYWHQVEPGDRLRFLIEMLTPNERRALQFGFEEND